MTEEFSSVTSILECNGKAASEKVPVQITDVIDGVSKSECENEEKCMLLEENEKTKKYMDNNSKHEKGADEISHETKRSNGSSGSGPDSDMTPENAIEGEVSTGAMQEKHVEENDNGVKEMEDVASPQQNQQRDDGILPEETEEELEMDEANENTSPIESDNENGAESCLYEQESGSDESPPESPTSGPHFVSTKGQPVLRKNPEMSKHIYSKYDTVSYRKIRRGNTKQRIDEFESMMNL